MNMGFVSRCLFLAGVLLILPSVTNAQQLPGGRNTTLEMLEKGFDVLGTNVPSFPPGFWSTPEGKARLEQLQMERFRESIEELTELGEEDWTAQYDSISDRSVRRDFEDSVEDLEEVTDGLIRFFEWRFAAEPIEVEEPSLEGIRERVVEMTPMLGQILEAIDTLQGGGSIEVQQFVTMRENLAHIHTLSRILRD